MTVSGLAPCAVSVSGQSPLLRSPAGSSLVGSVLEKLTRFTRGGELSTVRCEPPPAVHERGLRLLERTPSRVPSSAREPSLAWSGWLGAAGELSAAAGESGSSDLTVSLSHHVGKGSAEVG